VIKIEDAEKLDKSLQKEDDEGDDENTSVSSS